MPASPSSTCATVGSRTSSPSSKAESNSKVESQYKSKSSQSVVSKHDCQVFETPAIIDQQERSSRPITVYVANPMNPNPSYTHHTIEQNVKAHTVIIKAYLDDFETKMATWDA